MTGLLLAGFLAGCAKGVRRMFIGYEKVTAVMGPTSVTTRFARSFLEAHQNRILIEATFAVDAVSRMVNPAAFDGDLHIAGRAPEIGFRLVAEIKNAGTRPDAVALLRRAERSGTPVRMTGAWRYWPEHAIGLPHRQGESLGRLPNANPDHVFEVHPVIRIDELDLGGTLTVVGGFRPGSAPRTFAIYENAHVILRGSADSLLVRIPSGLVNDVHFWMEPLDPPTETGDGLSITGRARDREGNLLADSVRMFFIRGTPPAQVARSLRPGAVLHVWGLPRISFAGLLRAMLPNGDDGVSRTIKLPYELIIVGIYPEDS